MAIRILTLLGVLTLLSGCATVTPEWMRAHTAEYQCPADMQLVCELAGSRQICNCRR